MPHIGMPEGLSGIVGLMAARPGVGARLAGLLHELLCGDGPLTVTERELIAAYVSTLNRCAPEAGDRLADSAGLGPAADGIDPRLRALLRLAAAVVAGGDTVTPDLVTTVREAGCTDQEIHDTVLLSAAFCMVSRYVDSLDAGQP